MTTAGYDAIVVGSGPGGALAAHGLVRAGARVLMLERGGWVRRGPENHEPSSVAWLSPYYTTATPYDADTDAGRRLAGSLHCVGGQSVFYAGVVLRRRVEDFAPDPRVIDRSDARWPYGYVDLEPYYARAERILGVSGDAGADPTEPWRSSGFPQASPPLSPAGRRMHDAARRIGLKPFRPPLAIARSGGHRPACVVCHACDGFACAAGAKGDASTVLTPLLDHGLELRTGAAVVRVFAEQGSVTGVEYVDVQSGQAWKVRAGRVLLAAGALATPHLLLASGLHAQNPGGRVVGRYLTRHCNAVVAGLFADARGRDHGSYKELAIQDYYHGHPDHPALGGLGSIQQEPVQWAAGTLPGLLRPIGRLLLRRMAALIVMSEDQPVWANRVSLDRRHVNAFGLPRLRIHHRYTSLDLQRRAALVAAARRVLAASGAVLTGWRSIDTFTHVFGTVRMGVEPRTSALDGDGRFRGFDNLYVVDGSALPTSAAVNPTLTIAAHALRVADRLIKTPERGRDDVRSERKAAAHAFA